MSISQHASLALVWGREKGEKGRSTQLTYQSLLGGPAMRCGSHPPSTSRPNCQGTWTLVETRLRWTLCSLVKRSRRQIQVDGATLRKVRERGVRNENGTHLVLRCKTPACRLGSRSGIGRIRPRPGYICKVSKRAYEKEPEQERAGKGGAHGFLTPLGLMCQPAR